MVAVPWKVSVRPPAAAGYARRGAVGIPTATLTQARAARAAVCHLTCRCNQRAKKDKEGEHVVVGRRAADILMTGWRYPNEDSARAHTHLPHDPQVRQLLGPRSEPNACVNVNVCDF